MKQVHDISKLILIFLCFLFSQQSFAQLTLEQTSLVPRPVNFHSGKGEFKITAGTKVLYKDDQAKADANWFVDYMREQYGLALKVSKEKAGEKNAIHLAHRDSSNEPDAYSLIVTANSIQLNGGSGAGVFYGLQTLAQLLPPGKLTTLAIPVVEIKDYPRFAWRGMHLDVSRHFFSKEFVKRYLDYLAFYKMNRFHWHLTDDQGWRIEIKRYPKLTEVGAWRNGTLIGHYGEIPERYDTTRYGGFYTQQDIREVVEYAKKLHITVIPEIEMPGHAMAAIAAYPELSCKGDSIAVSKTWGVFEDVFCTREQTIVFLQNVLEEVCTLFPGPYIHIGGDECPKDRWKICVFCQARMKAEGLKDENELQSYFVRRMDKFLHEKGKQLIGWDEILEGGLSPGAVVMSWRGNEGGIHAAREGHDVVMTPGSHCYFDHYQSRYPGEPLAIGGYLPLQKVYEFEPVPDSLNAQEAKHILGAQANLWTEYISNEKQVEYMLFPRLCALAEVDWLPANKKDYANFSARIGNHFKLMEFRKTTFSKALYDIQYTTMLDSTGKNIALEMHSTLPGAVIRYTLDGTDPVATSEQYTGIFSLHRSTQLKAALFNGPFTNGRMLQTRIKINQATAKNIVLVNPPSGQYNQGGTYTLVNGVTGNLPWNVADWLGFSGTDLDATIDLGSSKSIVRVGLDVLAEERNWIYPPKRVEISVSNDSTNFKVVGTRDSITWTPITRTIEFRIPKTSARYVRIFAENFGTIPTGNPGEGNKAWLMADEIIVE